MGMGAHWRRSQVPQFPPLGRRQRYRCDRVRMHATHQTGLLRIPEAAERLNVSRASVYRWIDQGRLPAVQLGGRGAPLRVPIGELQEWLALSHVTPAERRAPAAEQSTVRQLAGKEQP